MRKNSINFDNSFQGTKLYFKANNFRINTHFTLIFAYLLAKNIILLYDTNR